MTTHPHRTYRLSQRTHDRLAYLRRLARAGGVARDFEGLMAWACDQLTPILERRCRARGVDVDELAGEDRTSPDPWVASRGAGAAPDVDR